MTHSTTDQAPLRDMINAIGHLGGFVRSLPANTAGSGLEAVGAKAVEGDGLRVRFFLNGHVGTFHRPHPHKEAKSYQVRDARAFLQHAGMTPRKQ